MTERMMMVKKASTTPPTKLVVGKTVPKAAAEKSPAAAKTVAPKAVKAQTPMVKLPVTKAPVVKPVAAKPSLAKPVAIKGSTAPERDTSAAVPANASPTAFVASAPANPVFTPASPSSTVSVSESSSAAPAMPVAALTEPKIVEPAAPAPKAEKLFVPAIPKTKTPPQKGMNIMNDTVKQVQETAQKFAADATAKVETFVADATAQTKTAYEKSAKMAEDAVAFQKDNLDAVVASSKLATAGVEKAAQHVAEMSRKGFEDASAALKAVAGAKTPAEFFTLQNDYAKSSYEAFVAETSKTSEATMKFFGEVFQPISSRFAVAAEKVKAATTL
jgi:phasin family protein